MASCNLQKQQPTDNGTASSTGCSPRVGGNDPFRAHQHIHRSLPRSVRKSADQPFASFVQWNSTNGRPTYYCELCQVHIDSSIDANEIELDGENDTVLDFHCRSNAHRSLVLQIAAMKSSPLRSWCAKQQLRMEQFRGKSLVVEQWQSLVRCKFYWLLLNYRAWEFNEGSLHYWDHKKDVEKTLDMYEWKERLLLLDLVLWKAACQSNPPNSTVSPNGTVSPSTYLAWRDWTDRGWKQGKAEMRGSSNIDIILRAVLPFLGDESEQYVNDEDDEDSDDDSSSDDSASDDEDGSDDSDSSETYDCDADCFQDDQRQDDLPFRAYRHTDRTWSTELTKKAAFLQVSIIRHTYTGCGTRCKTTFQCELCRVEMTSEKDITRHCRESFHKSRTKQVLAMQRCPVTVWCAAIQCRLESFGAKVAAEPWQVVIKNKMFWILLYAPAWTASTDLTELHDRQSEVETMVRTHEMEQRVFLLKLAVWKAFCIGNPPPGATSNYHGWCDWTFGGWKESAMAHFNDPEIELVLAAVQPFLCG
jgi:hypothetical protein